MLLPALRAIAYGELTAERQRELADALELERRPRTEGLGKEQSVAHRSSVDEATGSRLVVDLAHTGKAGWAFALFFEGKRPSEATVAEYRALFRGVIDRFGLRVVEVEPPATADGVYAPAEEPSDQPEGGIGVSWELPYRELDQAWMHLGLRRDAPREVKAVKLRALMRTPVWQAAPEPLRSQAEEFLRDL